MAAGHDRNPVPLVSDPNSIAKEEEFDPDEVVFLDPVLQAGLRTIREDGTYERILQEMGFSL